MDSLISALQSLYQGIGLGTNINDGDIYGLSSAFLLLALALLQLRGSYSSEKPPEKSIDKFVEQKPEEKKVTKPVEKEIVEISFSDRLKKGLSRSRSEVWGRIGTILSGKNLDEDTLEELEELLYGADIGPTAAQELIDEVESKFNKNESDATNFKEFIYQFLSSKMESIQSQVDQDLYNFDPANKGKTKVIMVVGVNGAGKTNVS